MAYIYFNGEMYFPIRNFDGDLLDLSKNKDAYYEVDELMAVPVAALNNKGYQTEMCCSGHAVGDLCCELADKSDVEEFEKEGTLITVQHHDENDVDYMCWVGESRGDEVFIIFKAVERFPSIPVGWKYKQGRLSYDIVPNDNPMSIYCQASSALETLMVWIEELPDRNKQRYS